MYELIKFFEENKENAQMLLDCMLSVFRDIMLEKTDCLDMLQNTDARDVIMRLSDKISMHGCVIITNDIIKTKEMLSRNANFNLLITALINGSWEAVNGRNSRSVL